MKMSIGQTIELIYLDKAGKITQRKMRCAGFGAVESGLLV